MSRTLQLAPGASIALPDAPWSARELESWAWPEPLEPAEWAERHRVLTKGNLQGPWRNANAPYGVGIMNLCNRRGVEQIAAKKAAQVGVSEFMRNVIGWAATEDPAPMGLLLPNRDKGVEIVQNDLLPMFRRTPALARLMTGRAHDVRAGQVRLVNGFLLHLMWSGSPASLASNPMKRAFADEANKFEKWSGDDADPISLVRFRLRTYTDAFLGIISTPTTRFGTISVAFKDSTERLYFLVPCPRCGTRQRLVFPQVKSPPGLREMEDRERAAQRAIAEGLAAYECAHPQCKHWWDERMKRRAVAAGKWGTVGDDLLIADGRITDAEAIPEWPLGTRLGLHLSALYCMWESCTMSHVLAECIRAGKDPLKTYAFVTSTLGEDWQSRETAVDVNTFAARCAASKLPEGRLPWWTDRVALTIDTQKDHFYFVFRAWGSEHRSQRVYHGRVETFTQLDELLLRRFAYDSNWLPPRGISLALIDSGGNASDESGGLGPGASRTQEVYAWALRHRGIVRPIKGSNKPRDGRELYWPGTGVFKPRTPSGKVAKSDEITLWMVDAQQCQDLLADMIDEEIEDADPKTGELQHGYRWALNQANDAAYNAHLSNMVKVRDVVRGVVQETWVAAREGARVDFRACEGYQVAAGYMLGVHTLPPLDEWRKDVLRAQAAARDEGPARLTTPDGRPFHVLDR